MAKRRVVRKGSEEPEEEKEDKRPAFTAPDFDETDFLQTENRSAKLIYISLAMAVVAGVATFGLMTFLRVLNLGSEFTIPLIVPLIFAAITVRLYKSFGIDIKTLEWKKWLENGFMFVLAWFAVWLVSMNPPFSDMANPTVAEPLMEFEVDSGQVVHGIGDDLYVNDRKTNSTFLSEIEGVVSVAIYTTITDNWKLEGHSIVLEYRTGDDGWVRMEEGQLNLTIGRFDEELRTPKNVSEELDETWLITSDEVRSEHMYVVSFDLVNQTMFEDSDVVNFRVIYTAKDTRENEVKKELLFKLTI